MIPPKRFEIREIIHIAQMIENKINSIESEINDLWESNDISVHNFEWLKQELELINRQLQTVLNVQRRVEERITSLESRTDLVEKYTLQIDVDQTNDSVRLDNFEKQLKSQEEKISELTLQMKDLKL